jgi:hypothetical protein
MPVRRRYGWITDFGSDPPISFRALAHWTRAFRPPARRLMSVNAISLAPIDDVAT